MIPAKTKDEINDNIKKFWKIESGTCPKCGGSNLEYGSLNIDGQMADYHMTCKTCGFIGKECYDMKFVGFVDQNGVEV